MMKNTTRAIEMAIGQKYRDRYGYVWILKRDGYHWYVYNPILGNGLWDNGNGLASIIH